MSNDRLVALRQALQHAQLEALVVSNAQNRRYLSGFSGSAGQLLISADKAALLSDFRYQTQAQQEAPGFQFALLETGMDYGQLLAQLVQRWSLRRIGFEADALTVAEHVGMRQAVEQAGSQLIPTEGLVAELRSSKDAAELALLRRAIAITDEAFAAVRPLIRPEMSERALAWELERAMRERGADGVAFEIIVAAGSNAARPHARPGDDQLGLGRPIVLDFGARYRGYHADMTRTIMLGESDEQFERIYGLVLAAQQRAEQELRAGMSGDQADALARAVIAAEGYGEAFGHSLGHGVGLEIHELPRLRRGVQTPVPANAVVSIEPGIYLEGWGGVRIEDLVLVRAGGVEVLTASPKDDPVILV